MKSFPLVGEVNPGMLQTTCMTLAEYEARGVKQIRIDISSMGGNFEDGLAIATRIRMSPMKIVTCGMAEVASSGLIIYAAGDVRIASPWCNFMFHEIAVEPSYDKISDLKIRLAHYENDNKRMISALSHFTKIDPKIWNHLITLKNDYFFDTKKAIELGLVHRMLK